MPFIIQASRKVLAAQGYSAAQQVGDLCYIVYCEIMKRWREKPRWTTVHELKKEFVLYPKALKLLADVWDDVDQNLFNTRDLETAAALAFDVFFAFHALDYEKAKRKINGDI